MPDRWSQYAVPAAPADKWAQYAADPDMQPGKMQPTQNPVPTPPHPILSGALDTVGDLAKGVGKGALNTLSSTDNLLMKIPGISALGNQQKINDMQARSQTHDTAQAIGKGAEQAGEFFLPGSAEVQGAEKLAPLLSKMGVADKAAPILARMATTAAGSGTVNKLQGGGALAGAAGGAVAGALPGAIQAIPRTSRAGEMFNSVAKDMADQTVPAKAILGPINRIQELGNAGFSVPSGADKLAARVNYTEPMSYREARDFASNISSISADEAQKLKPMMKAALGSLRVGLHGDISDAAAMVGRGEDYASAVKEYAQAAKLKDVMGKIGKYGAGAAGAAGVYEGLNRLKQMF